MTIANNTFFQQSFLSFYFGPLYKEFPHYKGRSLLTGAKADLEEYAHDTSEFHLKFVFRTRFLPNFPC